jgi:putative membrane-bound dehydrogenase-like protein
MVSLIDFKFKRYLDPMIRLLVVAVVFLFYGCNSEPVKFDSLTEDQKRLPENALAAMHVAEGLEVELFASEPMVTNPTNISVDSKGRVWVCEAYNYDVSPEQEDKKGDRIIVLEDTDHDGKADKRTVFYQGTDITTPLGIMVVGNKVYVTRSPNLFVFTDTDGDLIADTKDSLFTNMGRKGDHSAHSMFPGADGKFYFSTGNYAGEIKDRNGNAIIDRSGVAVNQKGQPYLGGMVLRCDPDGKNFEVLGHNFRNNYEPCIDSYGNIFQSDNDDDGNESCRVNFVMYYGNYGYLDERTKASWNVNRVNIEKTVQQRHWHQNDPGVVPNMLITGAGSPAGMAFYEGDHLPEAFRNMPIHAEPYYNVVRAYPIQPADAGFSASIKDVLKSDDQWFRPVDVSVAPDGSLIIADWYDPILGGGAAGDANRGRIYRVAKDRSRYDIPSHDLSSLHGAIDGLKNPNPETRYESLLKLKENDSESKNPLLALWKSDDQVFRARAFWILASAENNDEIIREALNDKSSSIRIAAIRAVVQFENDVVKLLSSLSKDPDPAVRRELAIALRYSNSPEAASLWTDLANQYDGNDRWYLEALGIGADRHADLFFKTWVKAGADMEKKSSKDIVWRSRATMAMTQLTGYIIDAPDTQSAEYFFRAFDFHSGPFKNEMLLTLLDLGRSDKNKIAALALRQMDADQIRMTPKLQKALDNALSETKGTIAFVNLIDKFKLKNRKEQLLDAAINERGNETGLAATDLLLRFNEIQTLEKAFQLNDSQVSALLESVKGKGHPEIIRLTQSVVADSSRSLSLRQQAIQTLGSSWPGETALLEMVKHNFPEELKEVAGGVLFNVYRSSIQREAEKYLKRPSVGGSSLPSIKELVASSGSVEKGKVVFGTYCISCHKINNDGVKFGPELTQIGSKLSKDGLFRAIIFPDDGISYGYESYLIHTKDGSQVLGIVSSETTAEVDVQQPGGTSVKLKVDDILKKEKSDRSIMPALASSMSKQQLIDLVEYLSSLKK